VVFEVADQGFTSTGPDQVLFYAVLEDTTIESGPPSSASQLKTSVLDKLSTVPYTPSCQADLAKWKGEAT